MNKEKYIKTKTTVLIIISIITVISILLGCMWHLGGLFGVNIPSLFGRGLGATVSAERVIEDEVSSINVSLDLGNIRIREGEQLTIEYDMPEKCLPEINVEDGVLEINRGRESSHKSDFLGGSGYNMTITVPSGTSFDVVSVELALGDVEIDGINCNDFSVAVDCGDCKITDISTGSITVEGSMGDCSIKNVSADTIDVSSDCGDVDIVAVIAESINAVSNMGDVNLEDAQFEQGNIESDIGDIDVSGDYSELTAHCDMGDINASTDRPESEVVLNLTTDLGEVRINE